MSTCIFVSGVALELVAKTLNDVGLTVVIVAFGSCDACPGTMELFDDKNQIQISITTETLFLLIIDKYELTKPTYCSVLSCKVQVPGWSNVHSQEALIYSPFGKGTSRKH